MSTRRANGRAAFKFGAKDEDEDMLPDDKPGKKKKKAAGKTAFEKFKNAGRDHGTSA